MLSGSRLICQVLFSLLALAAGWTAYGRIASTDRFVEADTLGQALSALAEDPTNAQQAFAIGLLLRDGVELQDLSGALELLERANEANPYNWRYRLELARTYEMLDDQAAAEEAYRKALRLNPRDPVYQWRWGNFLIRQSRFDEAVPIFIEAVRSQPELGGVCLQILWKLGFDARAVRQVWPDGRVLQLQLLESLSSRPDPLSFEVSKEVWELLKDEPEPLTPRQANPFLTQLLERSELVGLREEWAQLQEAFGCEDPAFERGSNVVWQGGFEKRSPAGLLGWEIGQSSEYEIRYEAGGGIEGSTGLRVTFFGVSKYFTAVHQRLVLPKPGLYRMSFQARSEALTSEQGVYMEVVDLVSGAVIAKTPAVMNSSPWDSYSAEWSSPEPTGQILLRFRRDPSRKLDGALFGSLWIDSVEVRLTGAGLARSKETLANAAM